MNPRLPSVRPKEVVAALQRGGWQVHRQRGSHIIMHKPGSQDVVVIPMHERDVPRGTLHAILKDAGLDPQEFFELLRH